MGGANDLFPQILGWTEEHNAANGLPAITVDEEGFTAAILDADHVDKDGKRHPDVWSGTCRDHHHEALQELDEHCRKLLAEESRGR